MQSPRTFASAMHARGKGHAEDILTRAHQGEAMARQKKLRGLDHYLNPKSRDDQASDLVAAMRAAEARGLNVKVRRIGATEEGPACPA